MIRVCALFRIECGLKIAGYMPSQILRKSVLRLYRARIASGVLAYHGIWG
jgi:hypothetical protein